MTATFTENFKAQDAKTAPKATIYTKGGLGNVIAMQVKLLGHGTRKYAQYDNAPYVTYIRKGKRTTETSVQGYNPYILIVEGWDAPPAPDMFAPPETRADTGTTIRRAHYTSFDERWLTDFNEFIAHAGVEIIADYRKVK